MVKWCIARIYDCHGFSAKVLRIAEELSKVNSNLADATIPVGKSVVDTGNAVCVCVRMYVCVYVHTCACVYVYIEWHKHR